MNLSSELQEVSLSVDAETIRAYAELTQDFNPIHLDPDFAARTSLGKVIAHGTMSLCLLWRSVEETFGEVRFDDLSLDVRFASPVYVDDVVTAGGRVQQGVVGRYDVWVRGHDGKDRITGVLEIPGLTTKTIEGDQRET